jgi:hypothetical protein
VPPHRGLRGVLLLVPRDAERLVGHAGASSDLDPRDTEWGAEWECKATSLDFCSLEGMCNYPESCPFGRGKFGGWREGPGGEGVVQVDPVSIPTHPSP